MRDQNTQPKIKRRPDGTFRRVHGMGGTREYNSWHSMMRRCNVPHDPKWPRYGGRGIVVCDRWKDFQNFYEDMGLKPDGMTLDRKDNDGNYEPGNCRWATPVQQSNNRCSSRHLTLFGETKTVGDWSRDERCKVNLKALYARLYMGWSGERLLAATIPGWYRGRPRRSIPTTKRR